MTDSTGQICLWFERDAEGAARFYAETFPNSSVGKIHKSPADNPSAKQGEPLVVDFTVLGIKVMGLNGGPHFQQSEAFSFVVVTEDQAETDRYWNAIVGNGGQESQCGWCKDKWGVSWQITPRILAEAMSGDPARAKRVFEAMMTMKKIDIAALEAAAEGAPAEA
jgi:predicted 3-demethylubiquinone-9 3-methyltransferase (glyoxalase superfamily)